MKKIFILMMLLTSCSQLAWKKKQPKKSELKAKAKSENNYSKEIKSWADDYYTSTILHVKKPLIKENSKEIFKICQGEDLSFSRGYSSRRVSPIKFKKNPLTVYTKSGFKKSVFVTKGICRELALLKSELKDNEANFRKSIKEMKIHYIYNSDSYAIELVLETKFSDIEFVIK